MTKLPWKSVMTSKPETGRARQKLFQWMNARSWSAARRMFLARQQDKKRVHLEPVRFGTPPGQRDDDSPVARTQVSSSLAGWRRRKAPR